MYSKPGGDDACMPLIPALGRLRQVGFWVQGQPGLQSDFQDSQDCYTKKPCLKTTTTDNYNRKMKNVFDYFEMFPFDGTPIVINLLTLIVYCMCFNFKVFLSSTISINQ